MTHVRTLTEVRGKSGASGYCPVCWPVRGVIGLPDAAPERLPGRCRGCYGSSPLLTPAGYCCSSCRQRAKSRRTNRRLKGAPSRILTRDEAIRQAEHVAERNTAIVEGRRNGESARALADRFGMSTAGVREIEWRFAGRERTPSMAHPVVRLAVMLQLLRRSEVGRALGV